MEKKVKYLDQLDNEEPRDEQLRYIKSIKNNVQFITWLIIISLVLFMLTFIGPILMFLDRL
jgi:hypothetical protein